MNRRVVWFCTLLIVAAASPSYTQMNPADGGQLYAARCASCHGTSGRGDGPVAALLKPRPRDFTSGRYKLRSTETGSLPTDEDIARSITDGLHGTAMPSWQPFIPAEQVGALVSHLKTLSPRFAAAQPRPVVSSAEPASSP